MRNRYPWRDREDLTGRELVGDRRKLESIDIKQGFTTTSQSSGDGGERSRERKEIGQGRRSIVMREVKEEREGSQ